MAEGDVEGSNVLELGVTEATAAAAATEAKKKRRNKKKSHMACQAGEQANVEAEQEETGSATTETASTESAAAEASLAGDETAGGGAENTVATGAAAKKNKRKNKKVIGPKETAAGEEGNSAEQGEESGSAVRETTATETAAEASPASPAAEEANDGEAEGTAAPGAVPKKKQKKQKKGPSAATSAPATADAAKTEAEEPQIGEGTNAKEEEKVFSLSAQDNSIFRKLGDWQAVARSRQAPEMNIPVAEQYAEADYPRGEEQPYAGSNASRVTSAEKRALERLMQYDYDKIRLAAECHRQVRRYVQSYIRPGLTMTELCQRLEKKTHELIAANGLECGWGFPTGCSLNSVAAHYTPNYGDNTVLQYDDVCKLDFGVQVGGRIVDCAFTIAFNEKYDSIVQASQEGTNTGLREAGIDARLSDIGAAIQETIESFEIELNGKVLPVKPVRNLNGHSIGPYQIHGGKSVPIVKNNDSTTMEEDEFYAIETFASCGKGYVVEDFECSHYSKIFDAPHIPLRVKSSKALLRTIEQNFGTLAFCRRWLDDIGQTRHLMALKNLVDNELVQPYPPLRDVKGSYVTQMEHTVLMRPTCKEVVSRGDDF
mmetsp:Transcript_80085/g.185980  ORF Transcript_80085/g.185980 Transcript_80085/m.185980 type:complete len:600 (+) Transcript_80085:81-1880(+)